jgi:hypothetical protein
MPDGVRGKSTKELTPTDIAKKKKKLTKSSKGQQPKNLLADD